MAQVHARQGASMGRRCVTCDHHLVDEINEALIRGDSPSRLSKLYAIDDQALTRHRDNHLRAPLKEQRRIDSLALTALALEGVEHIRTVMLTTHDEQVQVRAASAQVNGAVTLLKQFGHTNDDLLLQVREAEA